MLAPRTNAFLTILTTLALATGCTSTLVKDPTERPRLATDPCSGSEWADDSTLATIPIPVVAFLIPHANLHDIKADDYLKRCGDSTQLVNREVVVHRGACIPTALTRIITLGIWQWCPAHVMWKADVRQ